MQGKNEKRIEIDSNASKTIDFAMPKTSSPETLNLTVFDKENDSSIDIRGRSFFEVIPRLERTVDEITICECLLFTFLYDIIPLHIIVVFPQYSHQRNSNPIFLIKLGSR